MLLKWQHCLQSTDGIVDYYIHALQKDQAVYQEPILYTATILPKADPFLHPDNMKFVVELAGTGCWLHRATWRRRELYLWYDICEKYVRPVSKSKSPNTAR